MKISPLVFVETTQGGEAVVRSTHPGTGATNAEGRGSQKVIVYTRLVAHVSTHHVKKKSSSQRGSHPPWEGPQTWYPDSCHFPSVPGLLCQFPDPVLSMVPSPVT